MKCVKCGAELAENMKFCGVCGTAVEQERNMGKAKKSKKRMFFFLTILALVGVCCGVGIYLFSKKSGETPSRESENNKKDIKSASIGDYVTFGTYEQDGNLGNGKEEIEWLVLEKEDGKALLLSKYALEFMEFGMQLGDVTWETCEERAWLNDEFYNSAFDESEKSLIMETLLDNFDNSVTGAVGGNRTKDNVFLLSMDEVTTYFDVEPEEEDAALRAMVTEYAKSKGAFCYDEAEFGWHNTLEYDGCGVWMLRTPGYSKGRQIFRLADVKYEGFVVPGGCGVYGCSIRPAIWVEY